jgi:methyl-accepting chemotaxis protein
MPRRNSKTYMVLTDGGGILAWACAVVCLVVGAATSAPAVTDIGIALVVCVVVANVVMRALVTQTYARMIRWMRNGSQQLTEAATALEEVAGARAGAAAAQSDAVERTTASVERLAELAASIADNARAVAAAADRTSETMAAMQDAVGAVAARCDSLGSSSQRIDEILAVIGELSEQTNLLALNAAIEAARAGAAGRGFAVVAGEVRRLAQRSLQSTESIRELVREVSQGTNATVLATEDGMRQARAAAVPLHETSSMLDEALLAAEQQRTAAAHVAEAMAQIRTATAELRDDGATAAATARRIGDETRDLVEMLTVLGGGPHQRHRAAGNFVRRDLRESGLPLVLLLVTGILLPRAHGAGWITGAALPGAVAVAVLALVRLSRARRFHRFGDRMRSSVQVLGRAVEEIDASTAGSATAATEQSAAVAEVSATIAQLAAASSAIASSSTTIADSARRTVETMEQLEATVGSIADRARALLASSERIDAIVDLVSELAEQTNLLALNAAIEAERSGGTGRGFAVVAEGIRALAERSLDASSSIRGLIQSIRAELEATATASARGRSEVLEVTELMAHTLELVEESAAATARQAIAVEEASAAVLEIRAAAEQFASAESTHASAAAVLAAIETFRAGLELTHAGADARPVGASAATATGLVTSPATA